MTKPLVSVIIPVYNVKNYLDKCVESVINQTLENIEIILVNDGSTDGSAVMCDIWGDKDPRIKIIHKENGGLSDARNVGMEVASADYIGFVDSDDYIESNMYEVLYKELIENKADLSYCGYYSIENEEKISGYSIISGKYTYSREEIIKNALNSNNITLHVWTKLYKREIALKHKFPVGKTYEDAFFTIPYLLECNKVIGVMNPLYYYVQRDGSIVNSPYSKRDLAVLEAHENNYKLLKDTPEFLEGAEYRLYWSNFYVLDRMLGTENFDDFENKKKILKFLKSNYVSIMKNKYVKPGRKLAMTALMLSEKLYKLALKSK